MESLNTAYSWAKSKEALRFGQLGWNKSDRTSTALLDARRVALPEGAGKPVGVAAGDLHTAIVDDGGSLWLCGSDRWLQLGQEAFWSKGRVWQREPSLVQSLARSGVRVVEAACGADHTVALDDAGRVWAFGRGEHGQLFGSERKPFTSPPAVSQALTTGDGKGGKEGARAVWANGNCSCALAAATGLWRCVGDCPSSNML